MNDKRKNRRRTSFRPNWRANDPYENPTIFERIFSWIIGISIVSGIIFKLIEWILEVVG